MCRGGRKAPRARRGAGARAGGRAHHALVVARGGARLVGDALLVQNRLHVRGVARHARRRRSGAAGDHGSACSSAGGARRGSAASLAHACVSVLLAREAAGAKRETLSVSEWW